MAPQNPIWKADIKSGYSTQIGISARLKPKYSLSLILHINVIISIEFSDTITILQKRLANMRSGILRLVPNFFLCCAFISIAFSYFLFIRLYVMVLFIENFSKIKVFEYNFLILLILPEGLILKKWVSRAKKKRVEEGREKMMSQERYINIKRSKVNNILGPAYIVNLHTLKSVLKIRFYVISLQQFSVQTFLIWQITW